ncbi:MAG: class IV adenylate cyclase [Promethearchaeota archaeon]|nr:MAG: class IV adenylate cyclase [Candidatus Lokiarchaeota archaeon]
MIEVEIKVKIENPNKIRKELIEKKGEYKFSLLHEDTYYNMPQELRDFRKTDEALRIRKSVKFHKNRPEEKEQNYYITYKGAKLDSSTKTRKEMETLINDGQIMKHILEILEFQEVLTVKKERELYEFGYKGKNIELLLDYLPILEQNFIEVELLIESEKQITSARDRLFSFLKEFNINERDSIRKSYLELIIENLE